MALIYQVLATIVQTIQAATANVQVGGVPMMVKIGTDWPPQNVLQDVGRTGWANVGGVNVPQGGTAVISVFDRKSGSQGTRWTPAVIIGPTVTPATVTSALSSPATLQPRGSATLTIGGVPTIGDAVSLVAFDGGGSLPAWAAQVAVAVAGDTVPSLAVKLAAAINADPVLGLWVVASVFGAVITLTSVSNHPVALSTYTGNGGSQTRELGRRKRSIQITCWVPTLEARSALVDPIETALALAELNFLTVTSDGQVVQLTYQSDYDLDDDTMTDIYRHDFLVLIDYPVTSVDQLFAIVAPVPAFTSP